MGEWNSLNELFTLGGKLFNRSEGKHLLKRPDSHHCEVSTSEMFARNFSMFFKVSQRGSF